MEFTIVMTNTEFIISTVAGPIVASAYFLIKLYMTKKKKGW